MTESPGACVGLYFLAAFVVAVLALFVKCAPFSPFDKPLLIAYIVLFVAASALILYNLISSFNKTNIIMIFAHLALGIFSGFGLRYYISTMKNEDEEIE